MAEFVLDDCTTSNNSVDHPSVNIPSHSRNRPLLTLELSYSNPRILCSLENMKIYIICALRSNNIVKISRLVLLGLT